MESPLQKILTAAYEKNVSENALQILYWMARFQCNMEETVSDVKALQEITGQLIPEKIMLKKANLQEMNLEAADLSHADLQQADLSQANLNNALIQHTNLKNANLKGAKLENTSLDKTKHKKALLKPVVQTGHHYNVNSVCYNLKFNILASGDAWRRGGKHFDQWSADFQYKEPSMQLLLQAFLQRIVNSGDYLFREYGLGRKRTDLLIQWP
jgi:uncharacterized protein YjbI with pentapeptide repeats